jgi:hypothetical protein
MSQATSTQKDKKHEKHLRHRSAKQREIKKREYQQTVRTVIHEPFVRFTAELSTDLTVDLQTYTTDSLLET